LLERQLDVAKDAGEKDRVVALGIRVAALREQAGDEDAALEGYHGVLDWDDKNLHALRAVMRIAERREDSLSESDLLDRLLEVETGDEATRAALRLADLKQAMSDDEGVERALVVGLRQNPASPQLRQRLGALYAERDDRVGLARLSAIEARGVADPSARKSLLVRAGESLRDEGAVKEAADAFADALDVDPLDRDVLFSFMDTCANTNQHGRAIAAVDRAILTDPADDDAWLFFSRAVLREAVGDSDLALDDLEQAFDKSGGGYHAELRAHLEAALVRVSRDPSASRRSELEIRLRLAEVTAQGGDYEGARVVVDHLLQQDPRNVQVITALGRIEERGQRLESAANVYAHLVGMVQGRELADAAMRLTEVARKLGRPDIARGGLERAVAEVPGDKRLRPALRSVYEDSGAIGELAELVLDEARSNEDEGARYDTMLEAARLLLYGTGDQSLGPAMAERSIAVLEEAVVLRPDDPDVLLLIADALGAAGRIDDARGRLSNMIAAHRGKRSKELGQAFYTLYRVESRDGNLSEALAALTKAFDNQPQNGGIAMELGQLALDLDDQDIAQRGFRAVTLTKVDGTSGVTTQDRAVAYYQLGNLAVRQGDQRRAKLMLDKALAEDPSLAEARDLLARLG
jgi:tetratricopeptide (TPR) repeat protein